MSRILLGLIIGLPLPDGAWPSRLVRATRALLDFLYFAQYPTHTSATLKALDDALASFHDNKSIFQELGIRDHFKLPKLHSLEHYAPLDNYDTQYSERLHIDFAKDAYRATNHKDEFAQMTVWLERKEKVDRHEKYIVSGVCCSARLPACLHSCVPIEFCPHIQLLHRRVISADAHAPESAALPSPARPSSPLPVPLRPQRGRASTMLMLRRGMIQCSCASHNDTRRDVICGKQSALGVLSHCHLMSGKGFRVAQVRSISAAREGEAIPAHRAGLSAAPSRIRRRVVCAFRCCS